MAGGAMARRFSLNFGVKIWQKTSIFTENSFPVYGPVLVHGSLIAALRAVNGANPTQKSSGKPTILDNPKFRL
jgi:hypothetical protein